MSPKRRILIFVFLTLLAGGSKGQDFQFFIQKFGVEDGLSNRFICALFQDKKGFMWIGTQNGLNRFDGEEFKSYYFHEINKNARRILSISEDVNENLWIVGGINTNQCSPTSSLQCYQDLFFFVFSPATEKVISLQRYLGDEARFNTNDIVYFYSENEIIKIQLRNGDFYIFDGTLKRVFSFPGAERILEGNDEIYFAIKRDSLFECTAEGAVRSADKIDPKINNIWRGRNRSVYLGALDIKPETFFIKPYEKPLTAFPFKADEKFWSQYYYPNNYKLYQFEDGHWLLQWLNYFGLYDKNFNLKYGFSDFFPLEKGLEPIANVLIDRDENIWMSKGEQLIYIKRQQTHFKNFLTGGTPRISTRQMLKDDAGWLWIVTYAGTFRMNMNVPNPKPVLLNRDYGFGLFKDFDGSIWTGRHSNEIRKYTFGKDGQPEWKDYFSNALGPNELKVLFRDKKSKKLWVGANDGLYSLDANASAFFPFKGNKGKNGLGRQVIQCFYENDEGLWVGTDESLVLLDPVKETIITDFSVEKYLPKLNIMQIHEDKNGVFWLATRNNGLVKYDRKNEKYWQFSTKEGLSHNTIYAVFEDDYGKLWLPSDYGLMRFDKESAYTQTFLPKDGLPTEEFNYISNYRDEAGYFYFGSLDGFTTFHPRDFINKKNEQESEIFLTGFQVLNPDLGIYEDRLASFNSGKKITIHPGELSFLVKFTLLDYQSMGSIRYAYYIEGLENTWNYQTENQIRFGNLPPGNYKLNIKGQGKNGQWTSKGLKIPIEVRHPFYREPLFLLFIVLIVGGFVVAIIRWRTYYLNKEKEFLESEVAQRTQTILQQKRELEELNLTKDRFFAIIAHELRGPLISFQGLSEKISFLLKKGEPEKIAGLGKAMDEMSQNIRVLFDNLLSWALSQRGEIPIHPQKIILQPFFKELADAFGSFLESKDIKVNCEIPPDISATLDVNALALIGRNLLNNAIKFSHPGGTVRIAAFSEKEKTVIEISDTGVGMTKEEVDRLANQDQMDSKTGTQGEKGVGLGWRLCKELIKKNHGDFSIKSEPGSGTTFRLIFPA